MTREIQTGWQLNPTRFIGMKYMSKKLHPCVIACVKHYSECQLNKNVHLSSSSHLVGGRCGRHTSPSVSSVIDGCFCIFGGSYVAVVRVNQSVLWYSSSSFSSPRRYHLQHLFPTLSLSRVFTRPNNLSQAFQTCRPTFLMLSIYPVNNIAC